MDGDQADWLLSWAGSLRYAQSLARKNEVDWNMYREDILMIRYGQGLVGHRNQDNLASHPKYLSNDCNLVCLSLDELLGETDFHEIFGRKNG